MPRGDGEGGAGGRPRRPAAPKQQRAGRGRPAPASRRPVASGIEEEAPGRSVSAGLGSLLRGGSSFVGSLGGLDAVRSLDKLAASAERASAFLDRLEDEVGLERAARILGHLEGLSALLDVQGPAMAELRRMTLTMEEMLRSLREVEHRIVDLHERVAPPLDRMRLPRPLRRRRREEGPGEPEPEPEPGEAARRRPGAA